MTIEDHASSFLDHAVIERRFIWDRSRLHHSGGAVTALALVAAYPHDVTTLVAHEPPLIPVAPRC